MITIINSLTDDEDLRQELWVDHLSGSCLRKLFNKVKDSHVNINTPSPDQLESIQLVISNPPSQAFLSKFSNIECSIMCLLAIGYNIGDLSVLLGMSEVSIRRIMVDISLNQAWDTLWHSRETSIMKRDLV